MFIEQRGFWVSKTKEYNDVIYHYAIAVLVLIVIWLVELKNFSTDFCNHMTADGFNIVFTTVSIDTLSSKVIVNGLALLGIHCY